MNLDRSLIITFFQSERENETCGNLAKMTPRVIFAIAGITVSAQASQQGMMDDRTGAMMMNENTTT